MSGRIDAVRQGRVLVLTMDDPATKNALSAEMMDAGRAAFESAATDADVGAVVLTGAAGTFCSGGNLGQLMSSRKTDPSVIRDMMDRFHGWVRAMRACPKPVVAAVEGAAAGAGFSVAMGCDLIVAAEDSSFVLAYVKVGLNPDGGASAFLGRSVPPQLAAEIMFEGGRVAAPRLAQLGIVNRVTAPGGTLEEATAWATRLAEGPTVAIGRAKRLIEAAYGAPDAQLDREADAFVEALFHDEAAEGIAAFFEKRAPAFPRG